MDLNYLFHRRQVELMRAADAACPESASAHHELAERYAVLIETMQSPTRFRLARTSSGSTKVAPQTRI